MIDVPLAAWWEVISAARWFGGKGLAAELIEVAPLPWLTPADTLPAVRPEIATIDYESGRQERYLLLVGYTANPRSPVLTQADVPGHGLLSVVEAPADPDCMRALLAALVDPAHPATQWVDADAIDATAPTKVWAGEQSNTTICLGDDRLFKLFRKLEPGRNLDVEVLGALNGSGITPDLYGTLVADLPGAGQVDLGMFVERVQGVTDGWEWACQACLDGRSIADEAGRLGAALLAVHQRLAEAFRNGSEPGEEVAELIRQRLHVAQAEVSELNAVASSVELALRGLDGAELTTQRVHGDFHLGQVLYADTGWTIIDFEGEPLKSLAERRRPDSVWRDVAGMLRSFDYVRGVHPEPASEQAVGWSAEAAEAFLNGYCQGADPDRAALDAYVLDKAIYEVMYETRNRPHWVHIPLGAVHEVARRTALSPTPNTPKEK